MNNVMKKGGGGGRKERRHHHNVCVIVMVGCGWFLLDSFLYGGSAHVLTTQNTDESFSDPSQLLLLFWSFLFIYSFISQLKEQNNPLHCPFPFHIHFCTKIDDSCCR
jgi:hypothetical protein